MALLWPRHMAVYWPCALMFRLASPSNIYFLLFETLIVTVCLLAHRLRAVATRVRGASEFKVYLINLWALALGLALHIFATQCWWVPRRKKKDEPAVHCCDPALSVLDMFGVWKRLSPSISPAVYKLTFFWEVDNTLKRGETSSDDYCTKGFFFKKSGWYNQYCALMKQVDDDPLYNF